MTTDFQLPDGFGDLAKWVSKWVLPTAADRLNVRCTSKMEELEEFYQALTPRAPAILDYLARYSLHELPVEAENLFKLLLALPHVAMAIELHHQPIAPNTPYPNDIRISRSSMPYG